MPEAGFDKNLNVPRSGGNYTKLSSKGEKIKFLIANTPHYETKHWTGERESVLCEKYNSPDKNKSCDLCDQWKVLVEAAGEDKKELEVANKLKPQVTFFYPILNLADNSPVIFQTAPSVHWTIVGYKEDGVDVFACAWSVERTEDPGNYYVIRRLDAVKLDEEQEAALQKAKEIKLSKGKLSQTVVDEDPPVPEDDEEQV
ncbi:MAG: hypothetical protein UT61_C0062G0015 [Candidatus Woesebacteria bacterium GW2011_GWA1_39_8]|uniref:Bacteriophage T4 Gp32 single-stranded DNA-binding domain-containing protein n=1 Tax=Candidatus Woesebacteria bacterium GW2011_GWA1_39_8 TaxID=1618552 RepID=A0A0G0RZQ3_9BACT|nr:MAG: hypothetical protein UT61_C0062G0015 [Candidatus Woesebacteria bacterium GW2011_GWA1_39_8]